MNKTSSTPLFFIFITFLYSLTHLSQINQITANTFYDVMQLFYAIFFWVFLFGIANEMHLFEKLTSFLYPLFHFLFKLNRQETAIYITCIFAGYPTYAKIIDCANLSLKSKRKLMAFCSHPSIGFTIYTLGINLFNDIKIGYFIFMIQVLTNMLIAFLYRKEYDELPFLDDSKPFLNTVRSGMRQTFEVFIYIFGFMLVFRIFASMLHISHPFLLGLFEFSAGTLKLTSHQLLLSNFLIAFSSLSVICQSVSLCHFIVSLKELILMRFTQAVLATILTLLLTI